MKTGWYWLTLPKGRSVSTQFGFTDCFYGGSPEMVFVRNDKQKVYWVSLEGNLKKINLCDIPVYSTWVGPLVP